MGAAVDWASFTAVLFDLDGVLTPTAELHRKAWRTAFNAFLADCGEAEPFTDEDYFAHVDGKPRYDGVRDFLAARSITLPEGDPSDAPGWTTVQALGNAKNETFAMILTEEGVDPYPGSVALLDHLERIGVAVAVVSSSANAIDVLTGAGLRDRFEVIVDGIVSRRERLEGKPAPDTFIRAARELGTEPPVSVVVEDAVSGVMAGKTGGFGLVIGVDREDTPERLLAAGADVVVADLGELVPGLGS
jgi:beta-phosphoglucomutase family hydrolase